MLFWLISYRLLALDKRETRERISSLALFSLLLWRRGNFSHERVNDLPKVIPQMCSNLGKKSGDPPSPDLNFELLIHPINDSWAPTVASAELEEEMEDLLLPCQEESNQCRRRQIHFWAHTQLLFLNTLGLHFHGDQHVCLLVSWFFFLQLKFHKGSQVGDCIVCSKYQMHLPLCSGKAWDKRSARLPGLRGSSWSMPSGPAF